MTAAIIVAAGRGQRMGGPIPKQYRDLDGLPVLRHTLLAFLRHPGISHVQAIIHPADRGHWDSATDGLDLPEPVIGGNTRQETVRLGLESLDGLGIAKVLIHDGVRPFVEQDTIGAVIAALDECPAVLAALPVSDTLKRARGGVIEATVDRSDVWRAQTPQGFRYAEILAAHRAVHLRDPLGLDLTDDTQVAERHGIAVSVIPGSDDNFKITTEADLNRALRLMQRGRQETHTGWGFDFDAFGPGSGPGSGEAGEGVMLCGIPVAHPRALSRTHNIDVPLNAATDALLGTIGGQHGNAHFRAGAPLHRGSSSDVFLREAVGLVTMKGGRIVHVDMSVLAASPDIRPARDMMVARLADLLSVDMARVGVKRVTAMESGLYGRTEGIGAQCLVTVTYPAL